MQLHLEHSRVDPHESNPVLLSFQGFCFGASVNRAIIYAIACAVETRHDYIGTEHILLGLLDEGSVIPVIERLGANPDTIESNIEKMIQRGSSAVDPAIFGITPRATTILEYALEESGKRQTDAYDLLIGTHREHDGYGAQALRNSGVRLEEARKVIESIRAETTY